MEKDAAEVFESGERTPGGPPPRSIPAAAGKACTPGEGGPRARGDFEGLVSGQLDGLYRTALGLTRKPTTAELERLERYVRKVKADREAERLADVFWVLLNSAEFRLNH